MDAHAATAMFAQNLEFPPVHNNMYSEAIFGLSWVRALPLGVAVERGVYFIWYYFSSFLFFFSATFLLEGVVLGLWNFAQSFKSPKNKILGPPLALPGGPF